MSANYEVPGTFIRTEPGQHLWLFEVRSLRSPWINISELTQFWYWVPNDFLYSPVLTVYLFIIVSSPHSRY